MWPEQLVEQARLLYRIFMRVRERVERAFLKVEQRPEIVEHDFVPQT